MTATIPARDLAKASTADLIAQYDKAVSSNAGRYTNTSPRQTRINLIVDLLAGRADKDDALAIEWLAS
jgi:hypothetical protein